MKRTKRQTVMQTAFHVYIVGLIVCAALLLTDTTRSEVLVYSVTLLTLSYLVVSLLCIKRKPKPYEVWKNGKLVRSRKPGTSWIEIPIGRFHRLDCQSLARTKPVDRVFVHTYEDAVEFGAAICLICQPTADDTYYLCLLCGTFVPANTKQYNLTCECGKLTVDSIGEGLVQVTANPSDTLFIGEKKKGS